MTSTQLIKKVVANLVGDPDMSNQFPPRPPLQEMEEAGTGAMEALPKRTLRERQYGVMPLVIRPEYSGDFLDKLRAPLVRGKPLEAAHDANLWDFSMPSEWLKHQEQPYPRVITDEFYDVNRPGEGAGYDDLRQWWDRSWDPWTSPEVSEDRPLRKGPEIGDAVEDFQLHTASCCGHAHDVVAEHLLQVCPMDLELPWGMVRTAMLMSDLARARITTKTHGTRPVSPEGVTATIKREQPNLGKWVFTTTSGRGHSYTTIFQFIPKANITDPSKLHVRVSCSCDSWIFWGAQYNAHMGGYLEGPVKIVTQTGKPGQFSYPKERDPHRQFLVCKHVLACIPLMADKTIGTIRKPVKVRLQIKPRVEIEMERRHERGPVVIPPGLREYGRHPEMHQAVTRWNRMNDAEKQGFIDKLLGPEEVAYVGYALPDEDTMGRVVDKLTWMARHMKDPAMRNKAEHWLRTLLSGGGAPRGAPAS